MLKIAYNYLNLPDTVKNINNKRVFYMYYSADGRKLRQNVYADDASVMNGTYDYIGPFVYCNSSLMYILTPEGRYTASGSAYDYQLKDHLGNVRTVFRKAISGITVLQKNDYYPFGGLMGESKGSAYNSRYMYNGKERLNAVKSAYGVDFNMYDYGARFYDPQLGRFHTLDPLADTFSFQTPYAYAINNPIRFLDIFGLGPGDLFTTIVAAAKDWGYTYNGASIIQKKEFGSTIYIVNQNGKAMYSYTESALDGTAHGVSPSKEPIGTTPVADIHSHGNDDITPIDFDDNNFSGIPGKNGTPNGPIKSSTDGDIGDNNKNGLKGYLTAPNGTLQEYDPKTGIIKTISTDMPSDPNDGSAKDNPLVPIKLKPILPTNYQY